MGDQSVEAVAGQFLSGEIIPGWRLTQPLWVAVERGDDGAYLVSDELFLVYGVGASLADALHDYAISLVEYYGLLAAGLERNPLDRPQFEQLQQYLRPMSQSRHAA